MKVTEASLPGVFLIEPKVFGDSRGFFYESFNCAEFGSSTGLELNFVQDNHSGSVKGVLRGLHYQIKNPQGKLVRVVRGEVFDVVVDLRRSSETFGKWLGTRLSSENKKQLWVPPGFAHGFLVLSDFAEFLYKTTEYWAPQHERCVIWNDPDIGIDWPIETPPLLSAKDQSGVGLELAELYP